jgi:hypothetical protein
VKFGIGRATYDASQEARNGDITRDEAIALIRRYDGEYSERFEKDNFAFLSLPEKEFPIAAKRFEQPLVDREYFDRLTNKFRSPHIWKLQDGAWKLRKAIYDGL